jgi:5-formyltetrahydrofolate cyclo-ligase
MSLVFKQSLRRELKRRRAALSSDERERAAARACANLLQEKRWQMARAVHIYSSFGDEFPTDALRRAAFADGKRVFAPVTPPDGSPYLFHVEIFPDTRFLPDSFGIPTPVSADGAAPLALDELLRAAAPDLVVTPLLGFDAALHRLGYGKGYYDRFLGELQRRLSRMPLVVGVAFYEAQFLDQLLPAEAHDVPMDCVATENGVISKRF